MIGWTIGSGEFGVVLELFEPSREAGLASTPLFTRSDEVLRQGLQRDLDKTFLHGDGVYDSVAVLILYWEKDDFTFSCAKEAEQVQQLFEVDLRYHTESFRIPLVNSYNKLEHRISTFKSVHDSESALLIIYYSGHGDPDDRRSKAVWTAFRDGEPTLDWFELQPMLVNAQADVFLLFDCCYASLAAKAPGSHGVELLAAAPSGGQTPQPGPYSFTSYFVQETRKVLERDGQIWVSELSGIMKDLTKQDPVYWALSRGEKHGILLKPLVKEVDPRPEIWDLSLLPRSKGSFNFTVLVKEPPDKASIRRMRDWLCSSAPSTVSRVKVESIVTRCASLQDFVLEHDRAGVKGRFLDKLPPASQQAIMAELRDIGEVVAASETMESANSSLSVPTSMATHAYDYSSGLFGWFEQRVSKLSRTIWNSVAAHPEYQSAAQLEQLEQNVTAKQAGIDDAAQLRLVANDFKLMPEEEIKYWKPGQIRLLPSKGQTFTLGQIGDRTVLVEMSWPPAHMDSVFNSRRQRIRKVISFLTSPIPEYFRILPCIGFTTEQRDYRGWCGFVFELPRRSPWPESKISPSKISLQAQIKSVRRVPHETRLKLAYSAALSLGGLHSVGWVHKGIRSSNILFLDPQLDLADGRAVGFWIFGFEHSRRDAEATEGLPEFRLERNIYAPPSRWGVAGEKFTYRHDLYALGVILLEIGFWCWPTEVDDCLKGAAQPEEFQQTFLASAGAPVRHLMGTEYSNAVLACLKGVTQDGSKVDLQRDIVNVLEKLCGEQDRITAFA